VTGASASDDVILKIARLGAWLTSFRKINGALPDEGAVQLALTRYFLAELDPAGPGVILKPEIDRNLFALIDPDDCHP
jgi:hypothetical protein